MGVINFFSVNSDKEIFGKKDSKEGLYDLFESIIETFIIRKDNKYLYSINGTTLEVLKSRVEKRLLELLVERENNAPEIVEWEGRFEKNEVFFSKNILGKDYQLYSGGIDSLLWGLSTLLDIIEESERKDKSEILIFYSKKRSSFREVKAKINLLRLLKNK